MAANGTEPPTIRWGIIGCGLISSWFVQDLLEPRASAPTNHIVSAIGSSSISKGAKFVEANCSSHHPSVYATYNEVYKDPKVDIVYIGTPHVLHLENALGAIEAGKHVLVEKPMAINARDAETMITAAKQKGVFLMEAVWTRFNPVVAPLQKLLHEDRILGKIHRVFCDFSLNMPLSKLPASARTVDASLGAGVLLDIGIYTLTWASLILDMHPDHIAAGSPTPTMSSTMTFHGTDKAKVDETTTVLLNYIDLNCQAVLTSTYTRTGHKEFCRIDGERGEVIVGAPIAASQPSHIIIRLDGQPEKRFDFPLEGSAKGFYFEADAVAEDLRLGKTEDAVCPLGESLRIMRMMDAARKTNGLQYPQD